MYDVNPLGPQMHLKELERRAVPLLREVRAAKSKPAGGRWAWLRFALLCVKPAIRGKLGQSPNVAGPMMGRFSK